MSGTQSIGFEGVEGVSQSSRHSQMSRSDFVRRHDRFHRRLAQTDSNPLETIELATLPKNRRRLIQRRADLKSGSNLVNFLQQNERVNLAWLAEELPSFSNLDLTAASDGTTPLQALLETPITKNDRQWLRPIAEMLIARGVVVEGRNERGQTSLHIAVQNNVPTDCLRLVLDKTADVNALDANFVTPLQQMVTSQNAVDPACFRMLIRSGGDLDQLFGVQQRASIVPPLYRLCERAEDFKSLYAVVKEEIPDVLWSNKEGILHHAAKHGSEVAIKILLDEFGEDQEIMRSLEVLLLEAAGSTRDAEAKVSHLISLSDDTKDLSGQLLVHAAAQQGSVVLLETFLRYGHDPNLLDADGNAAIHYAALVKGSNGPESIHVLVQYGANVNCVNKQGSLPVSIALSRGNADQVLVLMKLGSNLPPSSIARTLSLSQIAVLADDMIIEASPNPLEATLELGAFFNKCAQTSSKSEYNKLALTMESKATQMLGCSNMLSRDAVFIAISNSQMKFLAHPCIQSRLKEIWLSTQYCSDMGILQFIKLFLVCILRYVLLPFFLLFYVLPVHGRRYTHHIKRFLKESPPCIRHAVATLLYILFIVMLVYDSCTNASMKKRWTLQAIDCIIVVYVTSFGLYQVTLGVRQGFRTYFSCWKNFIDIFVVITFAGYCIFRFLITMTADPSIGQVELIGFRVVLILSGLATFLASLRLLDFIKVYPRMGTAIVSLQQVVCDVAVFLLILMIFATAFALGISNVYTSGRYTDKYENAVRTCLNTTIHVDLSRPTSGLFNETLDFVTRDTNSMFTFDCVHNVFDSLSSSHKPVPDAVDGFVLTIATMVWALFGLINADDFNAASPLETIVGKVGIALWLMVATISLLIMFSIAVTKIVQVKQDHIDIHWKFAQAIVIHTHETSPTVPPPLNIPYTIALAIAFICTCCLKKAEREDDLEEADCVAESASAMIQNYKRQEAEEQDSELAKKADIKSINQRLLSLESTLCSWSTNRKLDFSDSGAISADIDSMNPSRCTTSDGDTYAIPSVVCQQLLEMMKSLHHVVGTLDRRLNGIETRMHSRDHSKEPFRDEVF